MSSFFVQLSHYFHFGANQGYQSKYSYEAKSFMIWELHASDRDTTVNAKAGDEKAGLSTHRQHVQDSNYIQQKSPDHKLAYYMATWKKCGS